MAAGLLIAGVAQASAAKSITLDSCMDMSNNINAMVVCQTAGLEDVDARLNTAYRETMAALSPDRQAKLRLVERTWITFREGDCNVFYGTGADPMAIVQNRSCMIDYAERRIVDLQGFSVPWHR